MARQLDLIDKPGLHVEPRLGSTEPRLWVRRLVLWSEPGVILRDVGLRPGLNIVWSPDPSDGGAQDDGAGALGHGSGKTLFCRLLRYCLGEERFAPDGQRDSIAIAFKDGLVGAEVIVDGTCWAIIRSIGMGRRHSAVAGRELDALAADDSDDSGGIAAFIEAVETRIISDEVAALLPGGRARRAWLIALAWLTRDQECRFDSVLDWRSIASDSGSPACGFSPTRTLDAVRALLGAVDPAEHALRAQIVQIEQTRNEAERDASHRAWEAKQKRSRLAVALKLRDDEVPPGSLGVEAFKKAALTALARVVQVHPATDVADLPALRNEYEEARVRVESLAQELAKIEARIPEIERIMSRIRGELPGLSFGVHESEHPVCPICEVPIDLALAEGCKLSHKLPDLNAIKKLREQCQRDLDGEVQRLAEHRGRKDAVIVELAESRRRAGELHRQLQTAESVRDTRQDTWYSARRLLDDTAQLGDLFHARDEAASRVQGLNEAIESKRVEAAVLRDAQVRVFERASQIFDAIVRELVGPDARGRISLDGKGLHLAIEMGGERSTTAIDSLKVLAFDLVGMCMSIEGSTHVPAFLLHDSPREADLGLSAYHRLFRLVRSLEEIGGRPLFQYIVTTTTRPPAELLTEPWLRLTLEGAPAERRLLGKDL